jgi:hypothetical protein
VQRVVHLGKVEILGSRPRLVGDRGAVRLLHRAPAQLRLFLGYAAGATPGSLPEPGSLSEPENRIMRYVTKRKLTDRAFSKAKRPPLPLTS